MIERQFVNQKLKEFQIQEYINEALGNVGHSHTKLQRTPLGEKIIVYASRPGLIVGRKGANIKKLTIVLKKRFGLENPQIEINEVENINLDAQIVTERIISSLEKFGTQRFKGVGHKSIADVMNAGALGVEILISGKVPSSRAKTWRFYKGYLKKCGDVAVSKVKTAGGQAKLKTGVVGIKVKIMLPDTELPDKITKRELPSEEKKKEDSVETTQEETPKVSKEGTKENPKAKKEEKKKEDLVEEKKETPKAKSEEKKPDQKKEASVNNDDKKDLVAKNESKDSVVKNDDKKDVVVKNNDKEVVAKSNDLESSEEKKVDKKKTVKKKGTE